MDNLKLDLTSLADEYSNGLKPSEVVERIYGRLESEPLNPVWISVTPQDAAIARAREIESRGSDGLPLYGIPFAVKDNIDVAGLPTTAACPAFAYTPTASATVVKRLEGAGAIVIGKANLDQFATGLVGVRTPYGACSSVFDDRYISGGSSSGSAVAVARGLVSFALGTDTAGSGRVPAAFNNLVGLKPTRGAISTAGVVPACRTLDCVSIFAQTCADAHRVLLTARGYDAADPYSRSEYSVDAPVPWLAGSVRVGVPRPDQLEFFGDTEAARLFGDAVNALAAVGAEPVEFDLQPFLDAAALLYAGPWVAERLAFLQEFMNSSPSRFGRVGEERAGVGSADSGHLSFPKERVGVRSPDSNSDEMWPTVREIVAGAAKYSAVDAFRADYRLAELRRATDPTWSVADVLLLPTTGTIYTRAEIEHDPIGLNSKLGRYTNFVNLFDLAGIAVPAGFRPNGLPFGVTVLGAAGTDSGLLAFADRLHRVIPGNASVGAGLSPLRETYPISPVSPPGCTLLAVIGAHLTGQPLNRQLTDRGARLVTTTRTASNYRLYTLPNTTPPKPGLVRTNPSSGSVDVERPSVSQAPLPASGRGRGRGLDEQVGLVSGIEVEVWAIPTSAFGSFVAEIPEPLGIGSLELADGTTVKGFICEPYAVAGALDITEFGGWRAYRQSLERKSS